MTLKPEQCLESGCATAVERSDIARCGGILFGTRDQMEFSCGGFFCNAHLWQKAGPAYCSKCRTRRKAVSMPDYNLSGVTTGRLSTSKARRVDTPRPLTFPWDSGSSCLIPECNRIATWAIRSAPTCLLCDECFEQIKNDKRVQPTGRERAAARWIGTAVAVLRDSNTPERSLESKRRLLASWSDGTWAQDPDWIAKGTEE